MVGLVIPAVVLVNAVDTATPSSGALLTNARSLRCV
jgi:hypothetical protein